MFVVGAFLHSGFASWGSVSAILVVASFVGFVAAGQTFVILVGGIDLSVPWVLNARRRSCFAVGSLGAQRACDSGGRCSRSDSGSRSARVNGFCVAYLAVPAVVMTLAMNGVMEGLTLGLTKGLTCSSCSSYAPRVLQDVVHKNVLGIPADLHPLAGRRRARQRRPRVHDLRPQGLRDRATTRPPPSSPG